MYRPLLRQQPWTTSGYICRQCRHHIAEVKQHQQARYAGTTPHEAGNTDGQDWADNFNSFSDDLPTLASRRTRAKITDTTLDRVGNDRTEESGLVEFRKEIGKESSSRRLQERRARKRSVTGHETGYGGLRTSLAGRVVGGETPQDSGEFGSQINSRRLRKSHLKRTERRRLQRIPDMQTLEPEVQQDRSLDEEQTHTPAVNRNAE